MRTCCAEGRLFRHPEDIVSAIRMLALDIDGTLVVRGDEISGRTRSALHEAHASGIQLAIATGRRYRTTRRVIDALGLDVPVVCLGGALIKGPDQTTIRTHAFDSDAFHAVALTLERAGLAMVGQRDSHASGGADFVVDTHAVWNDPVTRYLEVNADHWEGCQRPTHATRSDVLVMGTFDRLDVLEAVSEELERAHPDRFFTSIVPTPWDGSFYLEVIPAHVSKWSGLQEIGQRLGIANAEICAVGDQRNDIPMVVASGLGVAMANAHEALKARADWVCGRHDEDGLVEVVDYILGRSRRDASD
jgi:hypothetical protein